MHFHWTKCFTSLRWYLMEKYIFFKYRKYFNYEMLEKLPTLPSIIIMKILYKYFFKVTSYYISPWDTSPCLASLLYVLWNYLFIWSVPCNSQLQFSLAQIIMMLSICMCVIIFTFIILIQCWWWLFGMNGQGLGTNIW